MTQTPNKPTREMLSNDVSMQLAQLLMVWRWCYSLGTRGHDVTAGEQEEEEKKEGGKEKGADLYKNRHDSQEEN